jgi:outer membrane autotransporter protein
MAHGSVPLRKDCPATHRLLISAAPLALMLATASHANAQTLTGDTNPASAGTINAATQLRIGIGGVGTMTVNAGESVTNDTASIGHDLNGIGTATISGANATWTNSGDLLVGRLGNGTLFILDGGYVSSDTGFIGEDTGSQGAVTVSGEGSIWELLHDVVVGQFGDGALTIEDGGRVTGESAFVGASPSGNGQVMITGTDGANASTLALLYDLNIGDQGEGKLTVTDGGHLDIAGWLNVGRTNEGEIDLSDGATASAYIAIIGEEALGTATLSDLARLEVADQLVIGRSGTGILRIESGAKITSNQGYVGAEAGSSGTVTVTGTDSLWAMTGSSLTLGNHGIGVMTIEDGGTVSSSAPVYLGAGSAAARATLNVLGTLGARGMIETNGFQGGAGTAELILDGGVVRASASTADFFTTYGNLDVILGANGGFFDTANHAIGVAPELTGVGSLTKQGTGTLTLTGANSYAGGTIIQAGTLRLGNGGATGSITGDVANDGILAFNRSDLVTFAGAITGNGGVHQTGTGQTILVGDNSALLGGSRVSSGILSVNDRLGGSMDVVGGRLQGIGQVGTTTNQVGGTIAPGNSIGTLTIAGDYIGAGGTLEIETELGGDSSATDRLVITGNASGTTNLRVINVGGAGAQTSQGIRVVDIAGLSGGTFALLGDYVFEGDQAMVAGAYAYRLYQGGASTPADGHWYLRSSLIDATPLYQAGAPVYEAYLPVLLRLNDLETLQQRIGNRNWTLGPDADANTEGDGHAWGRVAGSTARFSPQTTTGAQYDLDTWQVQAGIDRTLRTGAEGDLIGTLYARYGNATGMVTSPHGAGEVAPSGYGLGGALTYYGSEGFYADMQGSLAWYDSTLRSAATRSALVSNTGALGYAMGIEAGQKITLTENWSVTPQAQFTYSGIDAASFTDAFGARIDTIHGQDLTLRVGISADYETELQDARNKTRRLHAYSIADLYYRALPSTSVDISGVALTSSQSSLWAGLGIGGTYSWGDARYALHGQGRISTSLENAVDNYILSGTVGLTAKF